MLHKAHKLRLPRLSGTVRFKKFCGPGSFHSRRRKNSNRTGKILGFLRNYTLKKPSPVEIRDRHFHRSEGIQSLKPIPWTMSHPLLFQKNWSGERRLSRGWSGIPFQISLHIFRIFDGIPSGAAPRKDCFTPLVRLRLYFSENWSCCVEAIVDRAIVKIQDRGRNPNEHPFFSNHFFRILAKRIPRQIFLFFLLCFPKMSRVSFES